MALNWEELRRERAENDAWQSFVNGLPAGEQADWSRTFAAIRHRPYPQYSGYWDGPEWRIVRVSRTIRTKGGVAFETGDIVLGRPDRIHGRELELYSLRLGWHVLVEGDTTTAEAA